MKILRHAGYVERRGVSRMNIHSFDAGFAKDWAIG